MNRTIYLCWLDDVPTIILSYNGHIELLESDFNCKFIIDEHYSSNDFDILARNIDQDLIFLIDYNISDGSGIDGNQVISIIRQHNQTCPIVFYSSNATQEELRELVKDQPNVRCVLREQIVDILRAIADGTF